MSHWEGLAIDGRVRYTKMVIRQSFLFLLKEQAIEKITVADVCRLAEINRATFYRHYENQYSILYELESDLLDQIPFPPDTQNPGEVIAAAARGLEEKKDAWTPLLIPNADPGLPAKLHRLFQEHLPAEKKDGVRSFLLHGLSGLLTDWMTDGFSQPAEQIAATAAQYFQDLTDRG